MSSDHASLAIIGSLAVWVTGSLSLLGLSISKEQKVSELRQSWIDELRIDLAALVAHSHQIQSYLVFAIKMNQLVDLMKLWTDTREDYLGLNNASTRIKLRLNRSECDSRMILSSMSEMELLFKKLNASVSQLSLQEANDSLNEMGKITEALERDAPPLLKKEWERVKRGEPFFNRIRYTALAISSLLLLIFGITYMIHLIRTACSL